MKALAFLANRLFNPSACVIPIILFLMLPFLGKAQATRDVIPGYVGWDGNPDSVTVYIDTSFSAAEKDSVREGMKRWNDAGGKPKFKEVSSKPAKIVVKEGDPGAGNAGLATITGNAAGKVTSVEIVIRNNPVPGLKETATHELGHSIGLDDVDGEKNAGDVMKGTGPPNGTDGNLSKHDTTELNAAIAAITSPAPPPVNEIPKKKRALAPATAVTPGSTANLQFDLEFPYPPTTNVQVEPAGDVDIEIVSLSLAGQFLDVQVNVLPGHGSGKYYMLIEVVPPLPDPPVTYLGYHFVNTVPVEPLTFQCPCEIYEENGMVHVVWKELHNYPYPTDLRAFLAVDGNTTYHSRGNNNFSIVLPPGPHTFSLYVDDYQVNDCNFTTTYTVMGSPSVPITSWALLLGIALIGVLAFIQFKRQG